MGFRGQEKERERRENRTRLSMEIVRATFLSNACPSSPTKFLTSVRKRVARSKIQSVLEERLQAEPPVRRKVTSLEISVDKKGVPLETGSFEN